MARKSPIRPGENLIERSDAQNFAIVTGTGQGPKLLKDVFHNFSELYNKRTLMIDFPEVLGNLQGDGQAKIEIVTSNTL